MIISHFNIPFISLLNKCFKVSLEREIRKQFTFNGMKDCLPDGDSILD